MEETQKPTDDPNKQQDSFDVGYECGTGLGEFIGESIKGLAGYLWGVGDGVLKGMFGDGGEKKEET